MGWMQSCHLFRYAGCVDLCINAEWGRIY